MNKYSKLFEWIKNQGQESYRLTFDDIEKIAGIPIDHSFLKYKKELLEYNYQVTKISLKERYVIFEKTDTN